MSRLTVQCRIVVIAASVALCLMCLARSVLAAETSGAERSSKPNILFVYLDDFGWRDCGFMGTDFYETPTLDGLAAEGVVFSNAYAGAANCAPSRACLLSGQYSPRHQIYNVGTQLRGNPKHSRLKHVAGTDVLRKDIVTWAKRIQEAGYRTGTIGKWHLSDDPRPYGFDFNFAGTHSGSPPRGYFPPHPNAPGLEDAPQDEYLTDRLSQEAVAFIERNCEQPWLLYLTHFAVHTPLQAPSDLVAKYKAKPPGRLHSHSVMAAMIERVDRGLAQICAKLKELGLDENTVIVFSSDNGGYGPATSMAPLKGYKGTYYEGGIRVPLMVRWPGHISSGKCDLPVANVDLYPTLCELAGVDLAAAHDGQVRDGLSLLPLLGLGETKGRSTDASGAFADRSIYWHFPAYLQGYSRIDEQRDALFRTRPVSVVRRGDWKLHQYFEERLGSDDATAGLELYNLRDDPGEANNLVEQNEAKARELLADLTAWQQSVAAPIPTKPNPAFDSEHARQAIKKLLKRKHAL